MILKIFKSGNTSQDEIILELRAELGWEGYGIFWAIIEIHLLRLCEILRNFWFGELVQHCRQRHGCL